jgi:excisionase family DNA binding protein
MTKQRYANIKEVSEYTSIPVKTLYEWSSVGKIPSIKLGRKILFDLTDIDQIMASLKRNCNQYDKTTNKIVSCINENII